MQRSDTIEQNEKIYLKFDIRRLSVLSALQLFILKYYTEKTRFFFKEGS